MIILTHRGLDPDIKDFPMESSREAFIEHLNRGFGLEFDVQIHDETLFISHDETIHENNMEFSQLLNLLDTYSSTLHAVHIKGHVQKNDDTKQIIQVILQYPRLHEHLLIFDLLPETAKIYKAALPHIHLAPSVVDPIDYETYNDVTHGTLLTLEQAIAYRTCYDWVWLDEWGSHPFYTEETFAELRRADYKICVVSPELHATSPGLLGDESHPDGADRKKLVSRLHKIIALKPDAICTDHPDLVKSIAL